MSKKIVVELNRKSIQNAIKQLKAIKKTIPNMTKDFLEGVALWIIDRANFHLNNSDIGENVKIDIRNGWEYEFVNNGIKITNSTQKAVFVEFGVGKVGEQQPHPEASKEGYEYNVPSEYKYAGQYHDEFTWRFTVKSEQDIDLSDGTYETWKKKSGDLKIITQGSYGVFYAYNAIVDAQMDLQNPNGKIAEIWQETKEKYIK